MGTIDEFLEFYENNGFNVSSNDEILVIEDPIGIYINEDYKFEDVVTFTLNISDEKMIINKKA